MIYLKIFFHFLKKNDNIIYINLNPLRKYKIINYENMNNFKSLKYLSLNDFIIENPFIIKLNNLIELEIINCDKIGFDENIIFNLEN